LLFALFLYPFQILSYSLYSFFYEVSPFDITSLLISIIVFLKVLSKNGLNLFWILNLIFIIFELLCFYFIGKSSFLSFLYILFIFNSLIIVGYGAKLIECNFKHIIVVIILSSIVALLPIFYEFFSNEVFLRPKSFFMEPSYAGLAFYSVMNGLVSILIFCNNSFNKKCAIIFGIILFFIGGVLTRSLHFVSCIFIVFLILFIHHITSRKSLSYYLLKFIALLILMTIIFSILMNFDFFASDINSKLVRDASVSTWIMGFQQMVHAVSISPIFGLGIWQTGYFFADNLDILFSEENPNLYDSYSLFFRLIIEFGLLPTFFILMLLFKNMYLILKRRFLVLKENFIIKQEVAFLFFFSITIIFGSLIKEPAYGRSTLFIAVFFLFNLMGSINRVK
jgi:hypothetical protein